jgi:hypothetical protein
VDGFCALISNSTLKSPFLNVLLVASQCWKFLSNFQKDSYPTVIWQDFYAKLEFCMKIYFLQQNFMNCDRKTRQIIME